MKTQSQSRAGTHIESTRSFRIADLLSPSAYPHPTAHLRLIETAQSWVLLTGAYAYKVKKPVKLDFCDYSSLALRHAACFEEFRLNQKFAPEIYLDVVPITGVSDRSMFDGPGKVVEYAVKMREFPQSLRLDRLLDAGALSVKDVDALAETIASLHRAAPTAELSSSLLDDQAPSAAPVSRRQLQIMKWVEQRGAALSEQMRLRSASGFVRELHGDLRLDNIVRFGAQVLPFDCIEFSSRLRAIDVISDVACITMELQVRGRKDLAYRMINHYLESSGDYAGIALLSYFEVCRAEARASQYLEHAKTLAPEHRSKCLKQAEQLIHFAECRRLPVAPMMILIHGLSGAAQSRLGLQMMTDLPAIRISARTGQGLLPTSGHAKDSNASSSVSEEAPTGNYEWLADSAKAVIQGGEHVIVDAGFLNHAQRLRFRALARELNVGLFLVCCTVPEASARDGDATLHHRVKRVDPLRDDELSIAMPTEHVDMAQVSSVLEELIAQWRRDLAPGVQTRAMQLPDTEEQIS
tara:strand:- start:26675 stop:28243 length:1569 start_codon:yes stop_codon:yes gene_type:complete